MPARNLTITYAAFTSVTAVDTPQHLTEPWDTFVARMRNPQVVVSKQGVGLFSGTSFTNGTGRRNRACATTVAFLTLDFDNSTAVMGPDGKPLRDAADKIVKAMTPNPVHPATIEAMLVGREFLLATSHSHTTAWPRFRVVLPFNVPIAASLWEAYADQALTILGFVPFMAHLDGCYRNPAMSYYWPSCPPGAPHYFVHSAGSLLSMPAPTVTAGVSLSGIPGRKASTKTSPFTAAQISRYWAHELPELDQATPDGEWRHTCPLHGGHNQKFYINSFTGLWKCQSKCTDLFGRENSGGDIYRYHERKYDMGFVDAKKAVHAIIGGEPGANYTHEELLNAIADSETVEEALALVPEIAKQPTKVRNELKEQLITVHPELPRAQVDDLVQQDRKVVSFNNRDTDSTVTTQVQAEVVAHREARTPDGYGLCLELDRFEMQPEGIYLMRYDKAGKYIERALPPIADRPIWPSLMGNDAHTGKVWIKLCWVGSQGESHEEWVPSTALNSRDAIMGLNDSPISVDNVVNVCGFLRYAKTAVVAPFAPITSAVGWSGEGDTQRFILPGDTEVEYIGAPIEVRGNIEGWAAPLRHLVALGRDGFTALAVVGLSAASPLVRKTHRRNPVVALSANSSTGKGKTIDFGLSIWGDCKLMTIPAMSSVKGTQDIGLTRPDFPIFVDEVQQLAKKDPQIVEDLVYYCGNGQRRVTSSRAQTAKGGERRYGASFLAAEEEIMAALQKGAQNRVIELKGNPLPDAGTASLLSQAAAYHCGVVGRAIADLLNAEAADYLVELEVTALELSENVTGLVGDDCYSIAFIEQGLLMLQKVTGVELPVHRVVAWLVDYLRDHREHASDNAEAVFTHVLDSVLSARWGVGGDPDVLVEVDGFVAFKLSQAVEPDECPLEIVPTCNRVSTALRTRGVNERIASIWANRGWIKKQATNLKWNRMGLNREGSGCRVWRVTPLGMSLLGLGAKMEEVNNVGPV